MKLIYCTACKDVVSLRMEPRTCFCGQAGGNYLEDRLNAVIWGDCVPLGFNNQDFYTTLAYQPDTGRGIRFTAFVIAKACETIKKLR